MPDLFLAGQSGEGSQDLGDWRQVWVVGIVVTAYGARTRVRGAAAPFGLDPIGALELGYVDDGTGVVPAGPVVSWFDFVKFDHQEFGIHSWVLTGLAFHYLFWRLNTGVTADLYVSWNPP